MASTIAFSLNSLNNQHMRLTSENNISLKKKSFAKISLTILFVISLAFSITCSAKNPTRFSVINVTASASDKGIQTLSRFQLSLSTRAYDAIDHGVPVDIVLSYAEPKKRFWGTSYKTIDKKTFRLSRHVLSDNYQLHDSTAFQTHQFITIDEALKHISIFQIKNLDNISSTEIAVRVHLDTFNLPPQIRASAFFSGSWRHDSLWTVWNISS